MGYKMIVGDGGTDNDGLESRWDEMGWDIIYKMRSETIIEIGNQIDKW